MSITTSLVSHPSCLLMCQPSPSLQSPQTFWYMTALSHQHPLQHISHLAGAANQGGSCAGQSRAVHDCTTKPAFLTTSLVMILMILTACFTLGRSCKPRWLLCWPSGATSFWLRPWRPSKRVWPVLQTRGSRCREPCATGTTELWLAPLPSGFRLLRWDIAQLQSLQASSTPRAMLWCKSNMHAIHTCYCALDQTSNNLQVRWQQAMTLCLCIDNIVACVMVAGSQSLSVNCNCSSHTARQIGTADVDLGQQQAATPAFVTKAACLYHIKPAGCTE